MTTDILGLTKMASEHIDYYEYSKDGCLAKIKINRSNMEFSYELFNEINTQIVFENPQHFMDLKTICNSIDVTIEDYKHNPHEY